MLLSIILVLIGIYLLWDGIISILFYHYHAKQTKIEHLGRVIRSILGIIVIGLILYLY